MPGTPPHDTLPPGTPRPDTLPRLPHAAPALLLTGVVRREASEIVCEGRIPAHGPWVRDGRCPAFVLLELAAQAAAALDALAACDASPGGGAGGRTSPAPGAIVRVRDLALRHPTVPAERTLRARATRGRAAPPLFLFAVRVDDEEGREILRAELGLHLSGDESRA